MNRIVNVFKQTGAARQLVMFPFGGGNGFSFVELANQIDRFDREILMINPPGHLFCDQPPLESIDEMVQLYLSQLRPQLKDQIVLFGHSMGGIVAYEICKALEKEKKIVRLFISAVNPPHCILEGLDIHSRMSNAQLIKACDQLGGIRGALGSDQDFLDSFANALRADMVALERYQENVTPSEKLKTPVTILYSTGDVMTPEKIKEWDRYVDPGRLIQFSGDHFYLFQPENRSRICRMLVDSLSPPAW